MGQAAEVALQTQGLTINALGIIAGTVTLTMGLVGLMLKFFNTFKSAFIGERVEVKQSVCREDVIFQTKTVQALERVVEMSDAILERLKEHDNGSEKLSNTLDTMTKCMLDGFKEMRKDSEKTQELLVSQNKKLDKFLA